MGLYYHPPGVYLGGQQPYDGRKGFPLTNPVNDPPAYSLVILSAQYVIAWQVSWGTPALLPIVQPKQLIGPSTQHRHSWHVGNSGIKTQVFDHSDVDSDPPTT